MVSGFHAVDCRPGWLTQLILGSRVSVITDRVCRCDLLYAALAIAPHLSAQGAHIQIKRVRSCFLLLDQPRAPNLGSDLSIVRPLSRMRTSRQLKYRCTLAHTQACQQSHLAAGEFERVVMFIGIVQVDLPEARHILAQLLVREESERMMHLTSRSNTNSVPGRRQTATFGSPTAANPRVNSFTNWVETSLSPTFAGRFATCCRL
jgi:hypothetical protein